MDIRRQGPVGTYQWAMPDALPCFAAVSPSDIGVGAANEDDAQEFSGGEWETLTSTSGL